MSPGEFEVAKMAVTPAIWLMSGVAQRTDAKTARSGLSLPGARDRRTAAAGRRTCGRRVRRCSVDHAGVTQERHIEPSRSARTAGHRAVFIATLAKILSGFAFLLGGAMVWVSELAQRRRARRAEQAVRLLEAQVQELKARLDLAPRP